MLAPAMPRVSNTLAGLIIPTLFSIAYAALSMAFWADAPGGSDSLDQALRLRFNPVSEA